MKKIIKTLLYFFLTIVCIYLIFAFYYGGFGKKISVYTSAGNNGKTLLFAHRGMYLYYPENSCEGIAGAKLHGFRASEVDIRRSADDRLIIFHDESCNRLLGLDKNVNTQTVAELKKYPIRLQNGQKSDAFISTVDELLGSEKEMVFYFDMKPK
ncbi:MAG: glycerophosphoryl diester phosphodiesterase [Bacteroidetes bacterium]|nr:glycerophosphoryl diester phosphodiesterase [Bacteroidota bacterium]